MALRVKIAFTEKLAVRGFDGKWVIDHDKHTLVVQVRRIHDHAMSQWSSPSGK